MNEGAISKKFVTILTFISLFTDIVTILQSKLIIWVYFFFLWLIISLLNFLLLLFLIQLFLYFSLFLALNHTTFDSIDKVINFL